MSKNLSSYSWVICQRICILIPDSYVKEFVVFLIPMTQVLSLYSWFLCHRIFAFQCSRTPNIGLQKMSQPLYNFDQASKKFVLWKNLKLANTIPRKSWQLMNEFINVQHQNQKINGIVVNGKIIPDLMFLKWQTLLTLFLLVLVKMQLPLQ